MLQPFALRDALLELRIARADGEIPLLPGAVDGEIDVWRDRDGDIVAQGYTAESYHWLHFPGFATYRFGRTPGAVTAIPEPASSIEAVHDRHRRSVLPLALQALGLETLHASGVVVAKGVVAFCGFPRTGKSTLAYGLHHRGYALWADDSVAVHAGRVVEAIPLPFRIRLRPLSLAHFRADGFAPDLQDDSPGSRPAPDAPARLAAVFILTRTGSDDDTGPRVQRLPGAAAFHAVLSHTQCFSLRERTRKQRMLEVYLALVGQLPVVEIQFRPGFDKLATVLDAIEQAVSGIVLGPA